MTRPATFHLFVACCTAAALHAETYQGKVVDPSGAVIAGAQIAAVSRVGVITRAVSNAAGQFQISINEPADARLMITASGFETRIVAPAQTALVKLDIAPQTDSIQVAGSAIDVPLTAQGSSVTIVPREEIRGRNEPQAVELLRYIPGVNVVTSGPRGSVASVFVRGGYSTFNLVEIDGIPVNNFGGNFDFANMTPEFLDRIEVARGPQSAVYGSYANASVINFITRQPEDKISIDLLAEGGSHYERRFAAGGSGMARGIGITAFASRLDDDGPVANSDYHNKNLFLGLTRNAGRQCFTARGHFNASDVGQPGPYGSDPAHLFGGIDLVSRNSFNFSDYGAHYLIDISPRLRQELFASVFWSNGFFDSPFGASYNEDRRGQIEERTVFSVSRHYTVALGFAFAREEVKNSFITDASASSFPLRRNQHGIYWENRLEFGGRLFVNAGARAEIIRTPRIPADNFAGRPEFPEDSITKLNPKIALAYVLAPGTRLHGSFGTGIRPPTGFDIAFTDNPRLKPERTASFDAGIEQRLFRNHVSLDATYFYNRYYDLIVALGGSLARLSNYRSDNLSNSRAQGAEFAAHVRPTRWISLTGSYTYLNTEILSLNGSSDLAPSFFRVGQALIRRPRHTGAFAASFSRRRISANVTGYFRGAVLDVEPNFGAFGGLFQNSGYANLGINLNYTLTRGLTLYGNLRNSLNQRYEEALGFPAPLLNFVSGMKWNFPPSR